MPTSGGISALAPVCALASIENRGSPRSGTGARLDRVHPGERRRLVAERGGERVERLRLALCLDQHALAVVQDEAAQALPPGEPEDERPEAHALDDPVAPGSDAAPCMHSPVPKVSRLKPWEGRTHG